MYPVMIESLFEYFQFLDFEYKDVHSQGYVLSKNLDQSQNNYFM